MSLGFICLGWCAVPLISAQLQRSQNPRVLLQGRFGGAEKAQSGPATLPLLITWPASSVHARFTGESINAILSAMPPTVTSTAYGRFIFYVDQREAGVRSTAPDDLNVNWTATDLGPGNSSCICSKA